MATFKIRRFRQIPYAICAHDYMVFKVSTGVKIPDKYWDSEKHRVKRNCPEKEHLQCAIDMTLRKLVNVVNRIQANGESLTPETIRREINGRERINRPPFLVYYKQYIELKKPKIAFGTYKNLKNSLELFKEFEKNCRIPFNEETLDKHLFEEFISF